MAQSQVGALVQGGSEFHLLIVFRNVKFLLHITCHMFWDHSFAFWLVDNKTSLVQIYTYLSILNLSLKLVKPKYVKPFLVSLLIILLVQDARSAALKIHTECFLLFLVANLVWFSLNSVTTLQTQFPLFNPMASYICNKTNCQARAQLQIPGLTLT